MGDDEGGMGKIARIILILVVVFLVLVVFPGKIWGAVKQGLGFGSDIPELEINEIDDNAFTGFDELVNGVANCRGLKEDDCGCRVSLSGFYKIHKLIFNDNGVELRRKTERSDTLMGDSLRLNDKKKVEAMKKLNCYYDDGGLKTGKDVVIVFDKFAYIDDGGSFLGDIGLSDDKKNMGVNNGFQLYKTKTGVCWVLNGAKVANAKICKQA